MSAPVFRSLQYARGIAAMAVVFFHATLASVLAFAGREGGLPWIGASGVDLFFVLSGFVMWTSTAGGRISAWTFYRRRIIRIVPLYWAATTVLLLLAVALPQLAATAHPDVAHVLASYLFVPWPNPGMAARPITDVMTPLLVPGWTLNYEMFFYLLFGAMLFLPSRGRLFSIAFGLPLVMLACMAGAATSPILAFYGSARLLEFGAGVLIGWAALAGRVRAPASVAWALVIDGLIALPLIEWFAFGTPALGLAAAAVIWGLVALEAGRAMPALPLRRLGDASFAIYLTHIFVIAACRVLAARVVTNASPSERWVYQLLFVAVAMAISAVVGLAVHHLFEAPVNRWLANGTRTQRSRVSDPAPVSVAEG